MLATGVKKKIKFYREFVAQDDSEEISGIFSKRKLPSVLGKDEFIDWVKRTFFEDKRHKQVPESVQLAPAVERIKEAVCRYYVIHSRYDRKISAG